MKSSYIITEVVIGVFFTSMVLNYVVFNQVSIELYSDLRELDVNDILQNKNFQKELISKIMNQDEIHNIIIQEFY